ncbi:MAG TPA: tryptophan synthase subunit alpha [Chloroflexota bacterium]|nr:tryptophan synthase subunit alpha [Chloroflexota bacterium]
MTARFAATFERLRAKGECGVFPYLTAGFPDVATSQALATAALEAGADGFEIGVPFSDPLADGATQQRANARALDGGATLDTALDLVRFIRQQAPQAPVALMSYYNPLRQRGDERVSLELATAQADAVIVPDLPVEESATLRTALAAAGLGLVPMLAPTSRSARIAAVSALEPVWIYCVALVGVTGARQDISAALGTFLSSVQTATSSPLIVGFGISQADHVRRAARFGAAGVIVASALTDLVEHAADPVAATRDFVRELKQAAAAVPN